MGFVAGVAGIVGVAHAAETVRSGRKDAGAPQHIVRFESEQGLLRARGDCEQSDPHA